MRTDVYTRTEADAAAYARAHGPACDDRPTASDEADLNPLGPRGNRRAPAGPSPACTAAVHWDGTRACTCCPRGCGGHVLIDPFLSGHPAACSSGCGWASAATTAPDPRLPTTHVLPTDPPF